MEECLSWEVLKIIMMIYLLYVQLVSKIVFTLRCGIAVYCEIMIMPIGLTKANKYTYLMWLLVEYQIWYATSKWGRLCYSTLTTSRSNSISHGSWSWPERACWVLESNSFDNNRPWLSQRLSCIRNVWTVGWHKVWVNGTNTILLVIFWDTKLSLKNTLCKHFHIVFLLFAIVFILHYRVQACKRKHANNKDMFNHKITL